MFRRISPLLPILITHARGGRVGSAVFRSKKDGLRSRGGGGAVPRLLRSRGSLMFGARRRLSGEIRNVVSD